MYYNRVSVGCELARIPSPLYWDDNNEGHLWESHRVSPDEVDEAIFGCDGEDAVIRVFRDADNYKIFGETGNGRLLKMVGHFREDGQFRVFHAMDMDTDEKRLYRKG